MILSKATGRDLQDIPEDVRNEPTFVQVQTVEEILKRGAGHRATPDRSAAGGEQYYTGAERLNMGGSGKETERPAGIREGGSLPALPSVPLSLSPFSPPPTHPVTDRPSKNSISAL